MSLEDILISRTKEAIQMKDSLAEAGFYLLQANILDDVKKSDSCLARGYVALAIFCKRSHFFVDASKYYGLASELFAKDSTRTNTARLLLANSLECKAVDFLRKDNFSESSKLFEQAEEIFRSLGKLKEAVYCGAKKLETRASEFEAIEEYKQASDLYLKCAELISNANPKLCQTYQGYSFMCLAKLSKKEEEYENAIKYFTEAAEKFKQTGNTTKEALCKGAALECKAFLLKLDSKKDYSEIAEAFRQAAEHYEKVHLLPALISKADGTKFLGLNAKTKGARQEAEQLFTKAKSFYYEALYHTSSPRSKELLKSSVLWCEGMATATKAENLLLENIPLKKEMDEVIRLLARASSLLSRSGDIKQAEIVSGIINFAMAIDAFHRGDIPKANGFIEEAKSALPSAFLHSMLKSEVDKGWQPLRYAIAMLESFDAYRRRIDAEKGYSFESRVRDLLRKMYTQYEKIEEKTFIPEDDEVGIVFKDKTPIEIDAIGAHQKENRQLLLVGEIKNLTKPVPFEDASKFLRKINFVEKRYTKIAFLSSMDKPIIEHKIFVSKSLLAPNAKDLLAKNDVIIIEGDSLDAHFKKYHLFRLPS